MCLAAAAMTLASCSDSDEISAGLENGSQLTFNVGCPSAEEGTRTGISAGTNPETGLKEIKPVWTNNDRLFINKENIDSYWSDPLQGSAEKASFTFKDVESIADMDVFYLSNKEYKIKEDEAGMYLEFKTDITYFGEQLAPDFLDGRNDFLVSPALRPSAIDFGKPVETRLRRLSTVLRINVQCDHFAYAYEPLDNFKIERCNGEGMYGTIKFYPETGNVETVPDHETIFNIHNYDINSRENESYIISETMDKSVYGTCIPVTLKKGEKIKFSIYTDNAVWADKIVTLPYDINLEPGKITTFNLTFTEKDVPF